MHNSMPMFVTGASGYMASWIVAKLLDESYRVHGTVRSLEDKNKVQHLLNMANEHPGQLELFEADLMKEGSFDDAMSDCRTVIHTASPYFLDKPNDPYKQLILPASEGTSNILNSVN